MKEEDIFADLSEEEKKEALEMTTEIYEEYVDSNKTTVSKLQEKMDKIKNELSELEEDNKHKEKGHTGGR